MVVAVRSTGFGAGVSWMPLLSDQHVSCPGIMPGNGRTICVSLGLKL